MAPTQRPQDLVFTLFGEYLLSRPGPVWVGSLIALLQPFGLSEGAIRTVLSRMSRKGWLEAERVGRHAFYDLTPRGRRLLEEGRARILHPSWNDSWDGRWLVLAYSIPEDIRPVRDRLRDRLAWLGFGSLGNGLWISPHDVRDEVLELAEEMEIRAHVECFRAERIDVGPVADLVRKCWDLPALNARYARFIREWSPLAERFPDGRSHEEPVAGVPAEGLVDGTAAEALADGLSARESVDGKAAGDMADEECYSLRFEVIHEFRRFPLDDPYLPRTLLPDDWHGERATELFHRVHDRLVGPADAYVDRVVEKAPSVPEPARGPPVD